MSNGKCSVPTTFCAMIDLTGFILFHSKTINYLNRPVHDIFLGLREPDLADALIDANFFVLEENLRSADSKLLKSIYRLNEKKLKDLGGTATGLLPFDGSLKCLQATSEPSKWYLGRVVNSNTALLVVDRYVLKSTTEQCQYVTDVIPPIANFWNSCISSTTQQKTKQQKTKQQKTKQQKIRTPKSSKSLYHICPKCNPGSFSTGLAFAVITNLNQLSQNSAQCLVCPNGYVTESVGLQSCDACIAGKSSSTRNEACVSCPWGKTASIASAVCTFCPAGFFARPKVSLSTLGRLKEPSLCSSCPSGWYSDKSGSKVCTKCPRDTYGPDEGSLSVRLCQKCEKDRTTSSSSHEEHGEEHGEEHDEENDEENDKDHAEEDEEHDDGDDKKTATTDTTDTTSTLSPANRPCYCQGTTVDTRKNSLIQYTDRKYDQALIKIYGSYCRAWDFIDGNPYKEWCPDNMDKCEPSMNWCTHQWCYVNDVEACEAQGYQVSGGTAFASISGEVNTFYSYELCGFPDCYARDENWINGICPFGLTEQEKIECNKKINVNDGTSFIIDIYIDDNGGYEEAKSCLCRSGLYYQELDQIDSNGTLQNGACITCPVGANCGTDGTDGTDDTSRTDGILLSEIVAQAGFWRSNVNSTIFIDCAKPYKNLGKLGKQLAKKRCCPYCNVTHAFRNQSAAKLTTASKQLDSPQLDSNYTTNCKVGYDSPLCAGCDRQQNYIKYGNDCIFCKDGSSIPYHVVSWFVFGLIFWCCLSVVG